MKNYRKIPFSPPDIGEEEIEEVVDTLRSGWITTGPKTKLFERKIAEYCGTSKAVALNSATAAMELTLRLLGVGPGDEVITSAYTYSASASVIHHVGAKIVLVDTAKDSFEMDYNQLADAITTKTKVIIPVDIAGIMCDYDKIFKIVESKKNLFISTSEIQEKFRRIVVLADAAHSIGASYNDKKSGAVADFTCFSFHAVKNLTTAEGGAVTWVDVEGIDNEEIYDYLMLLSLHGQSKDALSKSRAGDWEYDIVKPLYKCNMTDIMSSLGLVQLNRLPKFIKRRKDIVKLYEKHLEGLNIQVLPHFDNNQQSSFHLFFVRLLDITIDQRNYIIERMANRGISTNVHYKPLPMLSAYEQFGFRIEDYPNSYNQYKNEITLPLHTLLTDDDVIYIASNLTDILNKLNL